MEEYLLQAREELKRLEHIIYVSLKYTRTVDVIIGALKRMVGTYDSIILAFLEKAQEDEKIDSIPKSPALCAKKVEQLYEEDEQLLKFLQFYHFLRTILKAPYEKREEYRRHVTHIVDLGDSTSEMKIDNLENCEKYLHRLYEYSWEKLVGKPMQEDL